MSTKSVVNAHYNYTGRKTIRQKSEYFSIKVTDRKENNATIHVSYNFNEIIKSVNISNDVPCELALDAYVKNNVTRATLDKQDIKHIFKINNCPEYEKIFFRIKLIANSPEEKGILLAANKSRITISDESRENEGENKENTFFKLIPDAEMKGQTWRVSWDETDNPKIFVNKRLYEAYSENRNVLQAFLLPEIIREILTGLFFRQKDLEDLPNDVGAHKWVTFFRQTLDENLNELSKLNDEEKFEKIDQITQTFSDYNWGNNKTLLDEILEGKL